MSELTSERLAELRRIAEEATPGPWRISDDSPVDRFVIASADRKHIAETTRGGSFTNEDLANARLIAAFDPPTVLAMLDEIECLRAENAHLISDIKFITAPIEVGGGADAYLRYEVDRLRREVDELQSEFEEQNSMLGKVILENDALTKAVRKLLDNREEVGASGDYVYLIPRNDDVDVLEILLESGGNDVFTTTYRQMDEDRDCWECTADDCNEAWCLNGEGTPSANNMRYCHGCGRRIVAEEPWEGGDGK